MQYKVYEIEWAKSALGGNLPTECILECTEENMEQAIFDKFDLHGFRIDGLKYHEYRTVVEFGSLIEKLRSENRLIIEEGAWPTMVAAAGVVAEDERVDILYTALERLACRTDDRVTLYKDGHLAELSFGVLWHGRWKGSDPLDNKFNDNAYMVGGFIYRGPARSGENAYGTAQHSWTTHT